MKSNNRLQKNIPDGWISKTLGDFLEKIEGGGTPSKENISFWNGSIPWASVKDVVTHNPLDTQDHISEEGLQNSSSRLVPSGTLIVPTRMALGHAVVFDVDVAINQDLKAVYPRKELLNKFLFYWFKSKKEFIERLGSGSTVSGIQQNELKAIKFLLPPIHEQKRIVSILETLELVIEKLAKKIKVKKNIKKGLMQNLLTGAVRLAGFTEQWRSFKLDDLGKTYAGIMGKDKDDFGSGKPFITYMNIYSSLIINPDKCGRVKIDDGENQNKAKYGDLFFTTSSETPHEVGISSVLLDKNVIDLYLNSFCFGFRLNNFKTLSPEFAQFYFRGQVFRKQMTRIAQGASRYNLSKKYFLDTSIKIPSDIKEQGAIADVLRIADKEIEYLNKKLSILKDQKKYLLNNLITGTIRTKA